MRVYSNGFSLCRFEWEVSVCYNANSIRQSMNFHFMRMFAQFPLVIIPVLVVTDAFHWNLLACVCVKVAKLCLLSLLRSTVHADLLCLFE